MSRKWRLVTEVYSGFVVGTDGSVTYWKSNRPVLLTQPRVVRNNGAIAEGWINERHWASEWRYE